MPFLWVTLPPAHGMPASLSAASGVALGGRKLYVVGDDQAIVAQFELDEVSAVAAILRGEPCDLLEPGRALRILPGDLPEDHTERQGKKPDLEALVVISRDDLARIENPDVRNMCLQRYSDGLVLIAGSGGDTEDGRRSMSVFYPLNRGGDIFAVPPLVSLEELHAHIRPNITGKLNIEGVCVYGDEVRLAQRGNSFTEDGKPAQSMIIRLSLAEVMFSLFTDLKIGKCDLIGARPYVLGSLPLVHDGVTHEVDLHFTDLDTITDDPEGRMVFSAAAEAPYTQSPIDGRIAGTAIGIMGKDGNVQEVYALSDRRLKVEGVDARYISSIGEIRLLMVPDPDDPMQTAPLLGAMLPV